MAQVNNYRKLERGKTYLVRHSAPKSGPFRGIPKKPFVGVYHGMNPMFGIQFLKSGRDWQSVQPDQFDSAQEIRFE